MALEGELKGLDGTVCSDCKSQLTLDVQRSAAGYYLGYFCNRCGPYSRETGYFHTREEAQQALDAYLEDCRAPENLRDTEHRPDDEMKIYVFDSFDEFMETMVGDVFEEFNLDDQIQLPPMHADDFEDIPDANQTP